MIEHLSKSGNKWVEKAFKPQKDLNGKGDGEKHQVHPVFLS